jgi:LuxR family maltose regulon positive regulatory protein
MPIIHSRIRAPTTQAAITRRLQAAWVSKVCDRRMTWIDAPAGYGKTVLLSQLHRALVQSGARTAWLTLDVDDGAETLAAHLCAALDLGDGRTPESLACDAASLACDEHTALQAISAKLAAPAVPVYLFIDNLDLLGAAARLWVEHVVALAPAAAHFICASRGSGKFKLARLRAFNAVFDLGASDLRFGSDEVAEYLAARGSKLPKPKLAALLAATEGWIAGLNLMLDQNISRITPEAASSSVALDAFFAEEVLDKLAAQLREFLLAVSLVREFDADICVGLLETDAARSQLRQVVEAGLFIETIQGSPGRYRLHPLFQRVLRSQLARKSPDYAASLHRRASAWFAERHLIAEALQHAADSGDTAFLSEVLERFVEDLHRAGRLWDLELYAARLPSSAMAHSPRVLMGLAWLRTRARRFGETRKLLTASRAYLDELKSKAAGGDEARILRPLLAHQEAMLSFAQDDEAHLADLCRKLLPDLEEDHPHFACTLYGPMISAMTRQLRFDDLDRHRAMAQKRIEQLGYRIAHVSLQSSVGAALLAMGRTQMAVDSLSQGLEVAFLHAGRGSGVAALAALPLAAVLYEIGKVGAADALIREYMPVAQQFSAVDQLLAGHLTRCRIAAASSGLDEANRAIDQAMEDALDSGSPRLQLHIMAERVRLMISNGAAADAAAVYRQAKLPVSAEALMPRLGTTSLNSMIALTWARLRLAQNRANEALPLARHWRRLCFQRSAIVQTVRWDVLSARLHASIGDMRSAQRSLRQALIGAEPGHLVRVFLDEGPIIQDLLEGYADEGLANSRVDQFAQQLAQCGVRTNGLSAVPAPTGAGDTATLSAKEREILGLLGAGLRNREIGERLGITEGTVKWYIHQIYGKTGACRRTQASQLARSLGLVLERRTNPPSLTSNER